MEFYSALKWFVLSSVNRLICLFFFYKSKTLVHTSAVVYQEKLQIKTLI